MTEPTRAEAVEALRQELKLAGHRFYAAASALGQDQGVDTVTRQIVIIIESVSTLAERITELNQAASTSRRNE
jgi:hypothetical protein